MPVDLNSQVSVLQIFGSTGRAWQGNPVLDLEQVRRRQRGGYSGLQMTNQGYSSPRDIKQINKPSTDS